ncbi:AbrB/MazE/SpoVT family DNA-binding domain-containing protein [Sphingomonas sp. HMP6]|uniref:AbrB/MazE/SpoVT family DNA-binding domain-containing protein n=1 Tax=Sphingomonas sp. HMP6 TaxID=1517551 RepID=UPI001E28A45C|nr:AbrB/MazE/SpoVT family DNA-binding domain-containing protein [Sphingomonas sp. HMP6]
MNAHSSNDFIDMNMTSKGQVLIPKALRDSVGLVPNGPVRVGKNDAGQIVVLPPERQETPDERLARIRANIESVAGTLDTGFATTDDYMDFIRPYRHEPL